MKNLHRSSLVVKAIDLSKAEQGTIEPALVLIPLLILVLSTLQIAGGVYARVSTSNLSQAALYEQALFDSGGGATSSTAVAEANAGNLEVGRISLPGGGTLLAGTEEKSLPSMTPLLPGGDPFTTHSLAISEEP